MRASVLVMLVLCACAVQGPRARALHEVDGELVYSNPPSAAAYEAYLRARVALNAEPPQLDMARAEIELAIRYDGRAPHLWTTRAEIAARAGDEETAAASAERALALRPGYAPAEAVLAQVRGGPASAAVGGPAAQ
ncbi:MAG: hypothetical protein AAGA54_17620 [Myxococcota bacterium]